ncbi:hypothetical protein NLO413_0107 [Candidatus Neoehrlichia lotoris str. RAC413]|uniref:Uncharacterized protein n=1 Tax=Candidatus Neoehrlichia procyonis str. RAC413 TaxID=1359163 RepID=A0A0F3NPB3_9RICK|nr:hypothetical protein NLO413_0107 [Candidatus Neoehrlichia lotoris str. RAC413]
MCGSILLLSIFFMVLPYTNSFISLNNKVIDTFAQYITKIT